MTISELIQRLEKLKEEHGDLPVHAFGCEAETDDELDRVEKYQFYDFILVSP